MEKVQLLKLIEDLRLGCRGKQKQAATEIRQLCKANSTHRERIATAGAIPLLSHLVKCGEADVVEQAVTALMNLFILRENRNLPESREAIQPLIEAMDSWHATTRENAAAAIFLLSADDENKSKIGYLGGIPLLVEILRTGTEQGRLDSIKALCNLSTQSLNKRWIVDAGAMDPLIEILNEGNTKMCERAASILAFLMSVPQGCQAFAEQADGIGNLVETVEYGSPSAKEHSIVALLRLSEHDFNLRQRILREVILPPLISVSKNKNRNNTPRAIQKANLLLDLLRQNCDKQKNCDTQKLKRLNAFKLDEAELDSIFGKENE